jgi:hypothetical protein
MQYSMRRHSLVGPLLLIGIGALLLLGNFGLLGWNVWAAIFQLWPLILVAVGIDILIGRRSTLGAMVAALVILVLFGAGLLLFTLGPFTAASLRSQSVTQPLDGASRAQIDLTLGAGALSVDSLGTSENLLEGTVALVEGRQLTQDSDTRNGMTYVNLRSDDRQSVRTFAALGDERWVLHLNPSIPLSLAIKNGAGEAIIDLSQLRVADLNLESGVGSVRLTLPATGRLQASVRGGVGQITILIPAGMAVRVHAAGGLSQRQFPAGFARDGDNYVSLGFDSADNRAEVAVSNGIGQLVVTDR